MAGCLFLSICLDADVNSFFVFVFVFVLFLFSPLFRRTALRLEAEAWPVEDRRSMLYEIIFSILLHARENDQTERINEVKHFLAAHGFEFWDGDYHIDEYLEMRHGYNSSGAITS